MVRLGTSLCSAISSSDLPLACSWRIIWAAWDSWGATSDPSEGANS